MDKKKQYTGMSLNEMLFDTGLLKEFDIAIKDKNEAELINILSKVNISLESAKKIIKTIFDDPIKYGFK